eukprot:240401-Chlamydomonas_euryale.AAC.6
MIPTTHGSTLPPAMCELQRRNLPLACASFRAATVGVVTERNAESAIGELKVRTRCPHGARAVLKSDALCADDARVHAGHADCCRQPRADAECRCRVWTRRCACQRGEDVGGQAELRGLDAEKGGALLETIKGGFHQLGGVLSATWKEKVFEGARILKGAVTAVS